MMKIIKSALTLVSCIHNIYSTVQIHNLNESKAVDKLKHLPDMILHTSDTIVIDFNDFYKIPE